MAAVFDFKKHQKELYGSGTKPVLIDVPEMLFIMVDGHGDPNTSAEYRSALETLFGLAYTIKMNKKGDSVPAGYFEYVMSPLEGLWWFAGDSFDGTVVNRKDEFNWTAMIRQPEFVDKTVFASAKEALAKKKPGLDLDRARLEHFTEGLCGQILHIGPYDAEPATIQTLTQFISDSGYRVEMSGRRQHHEIYLSDPSRTAPEKLKTILRHPIVP